MQQEYQEPISIRCPKCKRKSNGRLGEIKNDDIIIVRIICLNCRYTLRVDNYPPPSKDNG